MLNHSGATDLWSNSGLFLTSLGVKEACELRSSKGEQARHTRCLEAYTSRSAAAASPSISPRR